ncbi:hypothetical protein GCM10023223_16910 [Stackebrandtia albiflava]
MFARARAASDLVAAIRAGEVIREIAPDSVYSLTDEADIATVAREALLTDDHVNRVLTVNGEPISLRGQVELIGAALGRTIPVEALTTEQIAQRYRSAGISDEEIEAWLPETDGEPNAEDLRSMRDGVDALARILGRRPRSYAEWLADNITTLGPA